MEYLFYLRISSTVLVLYTSLQIYKTVKNISVGSIFGSLELQKVKKEK